MKILVTALHWGLGHATRCIPIVRALQADGHEVILASDGAALLLLQEEFPELIAIELPAYNIRYPTGNMMWNMLIQSRKFFKAIQSEYADTQDIVRNYDIKVILSDNRFGCYSSLVEKNIFITHQLNLLTPFGIFDAPARWVNRFLMRNFDEIWIPDVEGEPNFAGKLSHGHFPKNKNAKPIHYLGILSRFEKIKNLKPVFFTEKKENLKVLIVLSGPEPQRTILEEKITQQIENFKFFIKNQQKEVDFLLIRGVITSESPSFSPSLLGKVGMGLLDFLNAQNLNQAMQEADIVVSRSGYTTVMDLAVLGKKALLIPTPGQTEQLYLARHFADLNVISTQSQTEFDLAKGIEKTLQTIGYQYDIKKLKLPI
jgi:uncharacterized protein (TIGR00661 family)